MLLEDTTLANLPCNIDSPTLTKEKNYKRKKSGIHTTLYSLGSEARTLGRALKTREISVVYTKVLPLLQHM